jgi:hypothetical protein
MAKNVQITVPREVLLVEIDRRCCFADCLARVRFGLARQEANSYQGFECVNCQRWNSDELREDDVPDWWAAIRVQR